MRRKRVVFLLRVEDIFVLGGWQGDGRAWHFLPSYLVQENHKAFRAHKNDNNENTNTRTRTTKE